MSTTENYINMITEKIIGCAIDVHKILGPGLLESAYEECLCYELKQQGLNFERQIPFKIEYKAIQIDHGYRVDLLVEDKIVVELKAVDKIAPIHDAQILTYLKMSNKRVGLLINFNVKMLKDGIKRFVN